MGLELLGDIKANCETSKNLPPVKQMPSRLLQDNYLLEFKNELAVALTDYTKNHENVGKLLDDTDIFEITSIEFSILKYTLYTSICK